MNEPADATIVLVFSDRLVMDRHPVWHDWGTHAIENTDTTSTARHWTGCGRLAWTRTWSEGTIAREDNRVVTIRRDTASSIGPRCRACERRNPLP